MVYRPRALPCIACGLAILISHAALCAQNTERLTLPSQGVVLLNTGYIFEGMLSDDGAHLAVKTAYGTIRLPKASIEQVARQRGDIQSDKPMRLVDSPIISEKSEEIVAPENTTENTALREWAATIPQTVRESFTRKVQPILMAKCATAECHGAGTTSDFRLASSRTEPNAAILNLRAALGQIDLIDPLASPLIAEPSRQHAGVAPLFSRQQQSQLSTLVRWADTAAVQVPKIIFDQLVHDTLSPNVTRVLHQQETSSTSSWSLCASPSQTPPKKLDANDPFDPEIFNMMYHAEKKIQ